MVFSDKIHMEAENMAESLIHFNEMRKKAKEIDLESLDKPAPQNSGHISKTEAVLARYPEPAQETDSEREYRNQQIEYEQGPFFEANKALAKSINALSKYNFTNTVLAAACNFTEMAEKHPRSGFIREFGPLIEEELQAAHTQPSLRLAAFTTSYFWKEANWAHLISAVPPTTTKGELVEFFAQPLYSDPGKRVIDVLPDRITMGIIRATGKKENESIPLDFKKERPFISINEGVRLVTSITELSKQNFTNRILTSTSYFGLVLVNPFNTVRTISDFGRGLYQELKENPDKPSQKLVTLMTEKRLEDEDIKALTTAVTPKTTKEELSEFFKARERWTTGLRMIDYLNHHIVMEMGRFLPEQDKLDLWSIKPEMVYDFNVGGSLRKFSPESQKKILDTVPDSDRRKEIEENMKHKLMGLHISVGLMGGGNVDTDTLDIYGKFPTIRKRRICSHADNRKFFSEHEHFRSAY
ncbi:MAG: hypothetical protein IKS41_02960 [Alphaproteobacteria bacterium]|nr:hypothetical protein [Alphaproteobacteria bacterium]